MTYSSLNFNGSTIVWDWITNVIPHFIGHMIAYPHWN